MSVLAFSAEKMGSLATSLISKNRRHGGPGEYWEFLTHPELLELKELYKTADELFDAIEQEISCFVDRLYIANQMAYIYSYDVSKSEIQRLDKKHIDIAVGIEGAGLLRELKSLRYNLYSNGGHSFVSKKDEEKLTTVIIALMEELIQKLSRDL